MHDHHVIHREFGNLKQFPNLPITGRLAEKDERRSLAVNLIADLNLVDFDYRHSDLATESFRNSSIEFAKTRCQNVILSRRRRICFSRRRDKAVLRWSSILTPIEGLS